ncbi:MAG: Homeodomain-like domain-containing protein, partial [Candidatus Kentron sp. G]
MLINLHYRINLIASEKKTLTRLANGHTTEQIIAKRAKIILMANGEGASNQQIADYLGMTKAKVILWIKRWIERALKPIRE